MTTTESVEATFTCADCHRTLPAWDTLWGQPVTSKYVVRGQDSAKLCADCALSEDRERILAGAGAVFGYASGKTLLGARFDGVHGLQLGTVVHVGAEVPRTRYGPFGARLYVRVLMFDRTTWHGTAATGMYCRLRRGKNNAPAS